MDNKKEQLYALLRANPYASQQDLARQLGLSRSAVAGHIAALTRERRILGRAYVLPQARPIVCMGGSNVDRKLRSLAPLRMRTSNPAALRETAGGVARNVAENLARLGLPVHLLTAVGDDPAGRGLLSQLQQLGAQTGGSLQAADAHTGGYTAVLDLSGELVLALAHMELVERMTPDFLRLCAAQRAQAGSLVLDLNLPAASVQLLIEEARSSGQRLSAVAVSQPKMERLPEDLHGLDLLILNRDELQTLSGLRLGSARAWQRALEQLRARGLQRLVVTDGAAGLRLAEQGGDLQSMPAAAVPVADVTGAGDAFAAGVCAALHHAPEDLAAACRLGLRLAALTLQTEHTVHPDLTPEFLSHA